MEESSTISIVLFINSNVTAKAYMRVLLCNMTSATGGVMDRCSGIAALSAFCVMNGLAYDVFLILLVEIGPSENSVGNIGMASLWII